MSKLLRISDDRPLPLDAVTQKLAFLGRTGSGKTYGATKLAECMLEAGAQIIALDQVGVWHGLRLGPNPFSIPVFGGLHGDIPLQTGGGALVADLIVDRGISAVLDVSQMIPAEMQRFAADFAARFFQRKKAAPSAVHVFLEECQEVLPQNPMGGEERTLHEFQRMQKLGRGFGIGVSLISQRPQEVSKKALNQTECVFAFQMTGPQERKALAGWVSEKGLDIDVQSLLPKLKVGTAHVWSPQWLEFAGSVHIAAKRTADVSATPKVGASSARKRDLAPIDLEMLGKAMAETIEHAKANDPRELKAANAALRKRCESFEHAVGELTKKVAAKPAGREKRVDVPVIREQDVAHLGRALARLERMLETSKGRVETMSGAVDVLRAAIASARAPAPATSSTPRPAPRTLPPIPPMLTRQPPRHAPPTSSAASSSTSIPKGERAVLIAAAQHADGVTREQLTVLLGYKRSTRDSYVQRLREKGLVDDQGQITATLAGVEALGADYEPLPTGDALRAHVLAVGHLPEGERKVLEMLCEAFPDAVERDAISDATGYKRSTRDSYIQRLSARKLVNAERGAPTASPILFDDQQKAG